MSVPALQQQARALGDPTRHAIFRYVADAQGPVAIAELTAHLGINHNAVRQHLTKLVEAALLIESSVQSGGPGRPRLVYDVEPTAESRWGVTGPYERLTQLLAEIIRTGDLPVEVGRRAGQRYRRSAPGGEALGDITETMARLGFDPSIRRRGRRIEMVLGTCPFASAAIADPDIICSLHLGIAEGFAEDTDIVVDELVAKDPRRAKCRLRLSEAGKLPG